MPRLRRSDPASPGIRRVGHMAGKSTAGWTDLHSADVNAYLKELAGRHFSAKDFRTWSATVHTAVLLATVDPPPRSGRALRRAVVAAVKEAAEDLGNTPTVCRASYIDPRVIDHFEEGRTIAAYGWSARPGAGPELREAAEAALLAMLSGEEELVAA